MTIEITNIDLNQKISAEKQTKNSAKDLCECSDRMHDMENK